MRRSSLPLLAVLVLCSACLCLRQDAPSDHRTLARVSPWESGRELAAVTITDQTWADSSRQREIPVRIYEPVNASGPLPLVLFSHGLGNSRRGYEYFGRYLAAQGYLVVHVQHHGTDDELGFIGLYRASKKSENWENRPVDVEFVIDRLQAMNADNQSRFYRKVDIDRIALAGHSLGGFTALGLAGLRMHPVGQPGPDFQDKRVRAVIALSPPKLFGADDEATFASLTVPALYMTGTRDRSWLWDTSVADRRVPFERSRGAHPYLVVLQKGTHSTFSDDERCPGALHGEHLKTIQNVSLAFLDGYLRDDPRARAWIEGNDVMGFLGGTATLEKK